MTEQQRKFYDSVVHGLRSQGWGRTEAEAEALDRVSKGFTQSVVVNEPEWQRVCERNQ
jgi:hypothetical protein